MSMARSDGWSAPHDRRRTPTGEVSAATTSLLMQQSGAAAPRHISPTRQPPVAMEAPGLRVRFAAELEQQQGGTMGGYELGGTRGAARGPADADAAAREHIRRRAQQEGMLSQFEV
jgi:hypothetical protein